MHNVYVTPTHKPAVVFYQHYRNLLDIFKFVMQIKLTRLAPLFLEFKQNIMTANKVITNIKFGSYSFLKFKKKRLELLN